MGGYGGGKDALSSITFFASVILRMGTRNLVGRGVGRWCGVYWLKVGGCFGDGVGMGYDGEDKVGDG